jgi:hypothetical protein
LQSPSSAGKISLFTQVTNYDNDNNNGCSPGPTCFPPVPDQATTATSIDYDQNIVFTVNSKLPQCPAASVDNEDTDTAVNNCKTSLVGSGTAYARIPGVPTTNNEVELTVSVFNGPTSNGTGGLDTGNPEVLLSADNASLPTTLVTGEVRPSPSGADYGVQLHVPQVPLIASGAGALVLFDAQVQKSYTNGKTGNKKKTYNYVTATCDDDDTPGLGQDSDDWDMKATWTFEDASTESDTYAQDCTQKT